MIEETAAPMSFGRRLWGVLVDPIETFRDISQNPSFWGALLTQMAATGLMAWLISPKVQEFSLLMMEKSGQKLPPEMLSQTLMMVTVASVVGALLVLPLLFLVEAGILKLYSHFTLGSASFKEVFAAATWAGIPTLLGGIIHTGLIMTAPASEMMRIQTSLALFLSSAQPESFLYQFMAKFDFFTLWGLALLALGGGCVMKQSPKKLGVYLLALWLLYALGSSYLTASFNTMPGV